VIQPKVNLRASATCTDERFPVLLITTQTLLRTGFARLTPAVAPATHRALAGADLHYNDRQLAMKITASPLVQAASLRRPSSRSL